jgi:hypothetical protein
MANNLGKFNDLLQEIQRLEDRKWHNEKRRANVAWLLRYHETKMSESVVMRWRSIMDRCVRRMEECRSEIRRLEAEETEWDV